MLIALSLFIAFTQVSPPRGCHPTLFFTCPTSFLHYSLQICPQFFFIRVSPPGGYHPGRSAPPLVTPLSPEMKFAKRRLYSRFSLFNCLFDFPTACQLRVFIFHSEYFTTTVAAQRRHGDSSLSSQRSRNLSDLSRPV